MDDVPRMSREKYVETMRTVFEETMLMRRDACRIRLQEAAEKIANVDGAPWVRNQIRGQSLPVHQTSIDW